MTQEQKELLLKDLCARLPYGVRGNYLNADGSLSEDELLSKVSITYSSLVTANRPDGMVLRGLIKPYLFPLSSMTEEQLYNNPIGFSQMLTIKADRDWENITINRRAYYKLVDWFNKNHFDYRGLIEKGLAIDATGLNIY